MSEQELNRWQQRCYALVDEKAGLEQQLAQARALLKRVSLGDLNAFTGELLYDVEEDIFRLMNEIHAFLASLEATDGK